MTECILIEKNCRRRSKASRSATPQAKPVSSPPEVMIPTQVMRLTSTSSKPVEEMQTNVKIELFVPSTGVDVKEVKSPLVYDSTETIPITNYNVKHIIPFIVRSPDSVDLDDSKSINSVSTAGAFLKPCVIGNSTGITNILSENLIRNLPMISQISQTDPTVKNSGRAELHILAHANVSDTTCALGSEVQNDSDWKNPIAKNIASLRSDPFSESNFKLPLPDHFFTFHGYRICLALTALDEKELQDFKLWLASAVVPLCTVSSLSTEMCITLSESVRTTSMKEVRE